MTMMKKVLLSLIVVVAMAAVANASVATLSIEADQVAKTWNAYISVPDTAGLSSFVIDVKGIGGVTVTGSGMLAEYSYVTNPVSGKMGMNGFNLSITEGVNGIGIGAGQVTAYNSAGGVNVPASDAWVIQNCGNSTPYLVASGTYSGDLGGLDVIVQPGSFVNTLNSGSPWTGPGHVSGASSVVPGHVDIGVVPEPATLSLLVLSGVGMLIRRRRA